METQSQIGMRWVRESIRLFKLKPQLWMLVSLAYLSIFMILPSLPGLGLLGLFTVMLWPVYMALAVMLFRQADLGQAIALASVIETLKTHAKTLMLLGLACLLYASLITYLLNADITQLMSLANQKDGMTESQASQFVSTFLPLLIKLLLLLLPLFIATWFSPMLIALNGYPLIKAVKSSIAGMLQYTVAMGVSWLVISAGIMAGMLGLGIVIGMVGAALPMVAQLFMPMLVLGALLVANSLMFAFQYISYRDAFKAAPVAV